MIEIFKVYPDNVIKSTVANGFTSYNYALKKIFPLVNRFDAQRKLLDTKFYSRLERDLINGCVMPHLTLAFVRKEEKHPLEVKDIENYINNNIANGYVLDGIQRLNTLKRASANPNFNGENPLLLNIIISPNKDMLLYRMITLNNGQKAMTARHQIEILTQELFNFDEFDIEIQSEKDRADKIKRGAFNLGDISRGYLAFLTDNVHNENNKIIDEKMDQILVGRILDSDLTNEAVEFTNVLDLIDYFAKDDTSKQWLKINNNLIGFCVGAKSNFGELKLTSAEQFKEQVTKFENAFKAINPSKVNLGKVRRDLALYFVKNYNKIIELNADELVEQFANEL